MTFCNKLISIKLFAAFLMLLPQLAEAGKTGVSVGDSSAEAASADGASAAGKKSIFAFAGYSGGMMLHSGYLSSSNFSFTSADGTHTVSQKIKGAPFGIGGALRVHFGKYLMVGTEGYSSTLYYGKNSSYEHLGWGGLLIDGVIPFGKWQAFAGVTVGGGGVKNVTALDSSISDFILDNGTTSYRRYAFAAIDPHIGVEYAMTERVHLIIKADFLFNVSSREPDFVRGPRLYFGFMFCH